MLVVAHGRTIAPGKDLRYLTRMAWTLQKLIDSDMVVTAFCDARDCWHKSTLDLKALRDRLGGDMPAMADDLGPRLRCNKCGRKDVSLTYVPDHAKLMARINKSR